MKYKNNYIRHIITCISLLTPVITNAQIDGLTDNTYYSVETNAIFTNGDQAPLWFSSNKHGLSSIEPNSGYLRAGFARSLETDSLLNWRYGYGLDLVVPIKHTSKFIIQQAYGDVQYKNFRVTVGAKEIPQEMLNSELSSGGMTISNNFRPIPQVRLEMPEFWNLYFTGNWLAIKGHIAYGIYTDNDWQKDFAAENSIYTKNSFFHSKSGFLRVGNEEFFPLSFTFGLQMACQFGGKGYNLTERDDDMTQLNGVDLGNGIKSFWDAFIPGGKDVNDGDYNNVAGNQTGNWYFELNYKAPKWNIKAYAQHFFEDHSQMFVQYGWKDMLWGIEAQLPQNHFVSNVLAEYVYTKDQTGGLYHDENDILPIQISGKDNYYNNHVYGAWQHWGQNIGNPLLLSPIYNANGQISCLHNRISALHFGISGDPSDEFHYKILYSKMKSLGTYDYPLIDPVSQDYFMAEVSYKPRKLKGWSGSLCYGYNQGHLLNNSTGCSITIRKTGKLF